MPRKFGRYGWMVGEDVETDVDRYRILGEDDPCPEHMGCCIVKVKPHTQGNYTYILCEEALREGELRKAAEAV